MRVSRRFRPGHSNVNTVTYLPVTFWATEYFRKGSEFQTGSTAASGMFS